MGKSEHLPLALLFIALGIALFPHPAAAAPVSDSPITGSGTVEYDEEGLLYTNATIQTQTSFPVYIDVPKHTQALPNRCLISVTGGHLEYKVPATCNSATVHVVSQLKAAATEDNHPNLYFETGTALAGESQPSVSVWWIEPEIAGDPETAAESDDWKGAQLKHVADMSLGDDVRVSSPYILLGDGWNTTTTQLPAQDEAIVHSMDSLNLSYQQALRDVSIPPDSEAETVSVVIFDADRLHVGEFKYGGAYYPQTNSVIINSKTDIGALFHEYSHSQQSYEVSSSMQWMIEAAATYDANREMRDQGYKNTTQMRESIDLTQREQQPDTVLSNESTWRPLTPYTEGQAVLAMIDRCLENHSETDGITQVQTEFRSPNTTVTFELFTSTIADQIPFIDTDTISHWLRPYIQDGKPVTQPNLADNADCWTTTDLFNWRIETTRV